MFDASRLSNLTRTSEMKALFLSALAIVAVFASCSIHAELSSEPAVAQALRKSWEDPRVKESLRRAINMFESQCGLMQLQIRKREPKIGFPVVRLEHECAFEIAD